MITAAPWDYCPRCGGVLVELETEPAFPFFSNNLRAFFDQLPEEEKTLDNAIYVGSLLHLEREANSRLREEIDTLRDLLVLMQQT